MCMSLSSKSSVNLHSQTLQLIGVWSTFTEFEVLHAAVPNDWSRCIDLAQQAWNCCVMQQTEPHVVIEQQVVCTYLSIQRQPTLDAPETMLSCKCRPFARTRTPSIVETRRSSRWQVCKKLLCAAKPIGKSLCNLPSQT